MYYKVRYFENRDESGKLQTVTTNSEGLNNMMDNPGLEIMDYKLIEIEEEMK